MDKFRLIAEVRKRPILWNSQLIDRPLHDMADSWKEVACSLGENVTAEICKSTWKCLRDAYRVGETRKRNRIERDKRNGKYDPKKNYGSKWVYYEPMKFFEIASKSQTQSLSDISLNQCANMITVDNSDREFGKRNEGGNNLPDPHQLEIRRDCNSSLNDNDISLHSSIPEKTSSEVHIIDDSDEEEELLECREDEKEFLSNDDESCEPYTLNDRKPSRRLSRHLNKHTTPEQKPRVTTNETNLTRQECGEKACPKVKAPCQEHAQILNADIKEEPVIDIESDSDPLVVERSQATSAKRKSPKCQSLNQHSETKRQRKENSDGNLSIPLKNLNNSPYSTNLVQNIGDPDYNFLISYLPYMKSLNALQNLQFRAELSDLILSFLTTSNSANELKRHECNANIKPIMDFIDPDCNFLISFWPYMKSLSDLQHLQYRAKMSHLIIDILSKDRISN